MQKPLLKFHRERVMTNYLTPKSVLTNTLQRVLNAAARVVSGITRKIDRGLTQLLHADLHSINQSINHVFTVVQVIKSLQDPLEVGNNLPGINDNVRERGLERVVKYELCMMMRRRQDGTAPQYLTAHWTPVSETASRHHLCSAASHQLTVPPHRRVTYGGRAFAVAGPSTWNSLPKRLRDLSCSTSVLGCLLKTFLFSEY